MFGFLLGVATGVVAARYWHQDFGRLRDEHMPRIRDRAAESVDALEKTIVDTVGSVSTRARSFLRSNAAPEAARSGPGEVTRLPGTNPGRS